MSSGMRGKVVGNHHQKWGRPEGGISLSTEGVLSPPPERLSSSEKRKKSAVSSQGERGRRGRLFTWHHGSNREGASVPIHKDGVQGLVEDAGRKGGGRLR